jgi:hypothetical protein
MIQLEMLHLMMLEMMNLNHVQLNKHNHLDSILDFYQNQQNVMDHILLFELIMVGVRTRIR